MSCPVHGTECPLKVLDHRPFFVPAGTCPGCGHDSHPGRTCLGATTDDVLEALLTRPAERSAAEEDPR